MRPAPTLADDVQNPKGLAKDYRVLDFTKAREGVKRARRIMLDDDAIRLAVDLADALPKQILQLLQAARPLTETTYIEFSSRVMLMHRAERGHTIDAFIDDAGNVVGIEGRSENARCGMLVDLQGDSIVTNCLEHTEAPEYMMWPLGFRLALEGRPYVKLKQDTLIPAGDGGSLFIWGKGKSSPEDQARAVWGYSGGMDMSPLVGRGIVSTHPSLIAHATPELQRTAVKELSGWARLTVAVLSMLNSVVGVSEPVRPTGRRIVGSSTMSFLSTSQATLIVPRRIRKVLDYARSQIRKTGIRHRLHEVDPHYRHLTYKPSTPGWQEVLIGDSTYWRKKIEGHLRGDPELGVVEKTHTLVKGRSYGKSAD